MNLCGSLCNIKSITRSDTEVAQRYTEENLHAIRTAMPHGRVCHKERDCFSLAIEDVGDSLYYINRSTHQHPALHRRIRRGVIGGILRMDFLSAHPFDGIFTKTQQADA